MLPKKNRIPRKDFPPYQKQLKRFSSPLFLGTMYMGKDNTQVSVVVSKKIAKTAVIRNKVRRRFYAAAQPYANDLKGILIVFSPKPKTEDTPFALLKSEIGRMFSALKLSK